jgi:hypothetical protein
LAQLGFWGLIGVEMWGNMHADQDPIASIADARRFINSLVTEAWPAQEPGSQSMSKEIEESDPSGEGTVSRPETEHDFRNR